MEKKKIIKFKKRDFTAIIIIIITMLLFFSGYSLGKAYQSTTLQASGEIAEPIFLSKNYNSGFYSDSNIIQKELKYQSEDLTKYIKRIKAKYKYRYISKLIAKPFIFFINLKYNKKRVG